MKSVLFGNTGIRIKLIQTINILLLIPLQRAVFSSSALKERATNIGENGGDEKRKEHPSPVFNGSETRMV